MPRPRLAYAPTMTPGTDRTLPSGLHVRYVDPEEYYVSLLSTKMNATLVFLNANMPDRVPADVMPSVDDAIADAYWNVYLGCLMPPRVLRALHAASDGPSGQMLMEMLETTRREVFAAPTLDDATELHATFRLQCILQGAEQYLTDFQAAAGEFFTDYILLQRAISEDIRRAERERASGETRASVLERMDRAAELEFEKVIGVVLRPQRMVDMIPAHRRAEIDEFARRRKPVFRDGVFAHVDGQGDGPPPGPASW
jgi:hypothetical protein